MNNFIFQNSTKTYFGKGCVKEYLASLVKDSTTVLLAYGGGSIKRNGIYDEVTGILTAAGKKVVEFPGIMSNPTYAKVQEGAALPLLGCLSKRNKRQSFCVSMKPAEAG